MTKDQATAALVIKEDGKKPPIEVGKRGLMLKTLEDLYRFGQYVVASGFAPKDMHKPEAVVVAIQYGLELGLTPMQALQNIAVINGKPTIYGDAMLALCMASGVFNHEVFDEHPEGQGDDYRWVCTVGRIGRATPVIRSFSIAQAKKAGLWGKPGPWQQFPDRMLQMRARAWALRDAFPDVLRGALAAEEMMGVELRSEPAPTGTQALMAKLLSPKPEQEAVETDEATDEKSSDALETIQQTEVDQHDSPLLVE